jgi:demethylmenaquinone methyltransferase/2-methoxy-6-polyprenyl-1,4-benzoquinol methylase
MPLLDHFGLLAPYYDHWMSTPALEIWQRVLRLPATTLLLDVGGGTARVSGPLAAQVTATVVVDVSAAMLEQAVRRPGIQAVQAPAEHLPFADGVFGRILMVDALHHVANTRQSVEEMLRVLAPGGRLVIEEPDWRRGRMRLVALAEKLALMRSHPERPEAIVRLARQAGARAWCLSPLRHTNWIIVQKPERAGLP